jgi:hypothetical protein
MAKCRIYNWTPEGKKRRIAAHRKHGLTGTRLATIFTSMHGRCYTPTTTSYQWYGARGIRVCEE